MIFRIFPQKFFWILLFWGLFVAGCGRKEDPQHPEACTFVYPTEEKGGETCKAPEGFSEDLESPGFLSELK